MATGFSRIDLRNWIAAVGGEQALNKPRLVANANKYAKLLTSETGLGIETAHDLTMMDVRDLCDQKFPTADAKAIVGMLNGCAAEPGDAELLQSTMPIHQEAGAAGWRCGCRHGLRLGAPRLPRARVGAGP